MKDTSRAEAMRLHAVLEAEVQAKLAQSDTAGAAQMRLAAEMITGLLKDRGELRQNLGKAERAARVTIEQCRREGIPLGRALANAGFRMVDREREEAEREAALAKEAIEAGQAYIQSPKSTSGVSPLRRYHRAMTAWEQHRAAMAEERAEKGPACG